MGLIYKKVLLTFEIVTYASSFQLYGLSVIVIFVTFMDVKLWCLGKMSDNFYIFDPP